MQKRRFLILAASTIALGSVLLAQIGRETSGYVHLADGDEFQIPTLELLRRGELLFEAEWTAQEGGLRPLTTGTGGPLKNPQRRLEFPHNFNRISAMDANSCAGCHNAPFGIVGGGGDFVTGVFVAAQRFDSVTFDGQDLIPLSGSIDESGRGATLASVGNYRATLGMFGAGYIEMLARQITADLRRIRDGLAPAQAAELVSKSLSYGSLARGIDGSWDVSRVEGLPEQSLHTSGPADPPSLVVHPFHQSGSVVSLRQFSNNAFNHHHGMQSAERFGAGVDFDGDGVVDELTRADITAVTLFQATLSAPGQVVPNDLAIEEAIYTGERLFEQIGCATCHVPRLPLDNRGWIFTEPNPYNPPGNLQADEVRAYAIDLASPELPGLRLQSGRDGVVWVPAYTDLKLHDITTGSPSDANREALNINYPNRDPAFMMGNARFLTKKLWGAANEKPYFHHGKFTTLREATLAHYGEASWTRENFLALPALDRDKVVEFLKSLQVLPPGVEATVVDENGKPKHGWPPSSFFSWRVSAGTRR